MRLADLLWICLGFTAGKPASVVSRDVTTTEADEVYFAPDFVVVTEDGSLHGFDSAGESVWWASLGKVLVNATQPLDEAGLDVARMVPAIDGSLFVVFPPVPPEVDVRIAHVNATIMSVVAESPFSTPAFPNSYLTGSKIQSFDSISFGPKFAGWTSSSRSSVYGRNLIYSLNDWTLSCIDTKTQSLRWDLSFSELPPLTSAHLDPTSSTFHQVDMLANGVELSITSDNKNILTRRFPHRPPVELQFDARILGVYAVLDAPDTDGDLSLVLVGRNAPIPTSFGGLPFLENQSHVRGVRVEYEIDGPQYRDYDLGVTKSHFADFLPLERGSALLELAPPLVLSLPATELSVFDFLLFKFLRLSLLGKLYLCCMLVLFFYIARRVYVTLRRVRRALPEKKIMLPDGTSFNAAAGGGFSLSSPTNTSSKLVLVHSEAIHPYEVVTVGQGDSVDFPAWQRPDDVLIFEKKLKEMSSRLTKIPFTHSHEQSEEMANLTVIFLGRNVDEPKLVFRNPRAENQQQRPNIPIGSQSIRCAVAASILRESPAIRAYVPRALCGTWNTFDGIFQEYVGKQKVPLVWFQESPQTALDAAFLILLLRDTDAHEGNYVRDLRRKVALFDLGCSLATRPLPADPLERMCLDNFEIWKRLPELLDAPFSPEHVAYLEALEWEQARCMWREHNRECALEMLAVLKVHANFLAAAAQAGRSILWTANVMYSGQYDDLWLKTLANGGDLTDFETKLLCLV